MLSRILVLCFTFVITSCTNETPALTSYYLPEQWQYPPVTLNIKEMRVVNSYEMPLRSPHVEHHLPISFRDALEAWTSSRLKTTGTGEHQLELWIEKAQVLEMALPRTKGLKGFFVTDQASRFDASFNVTLKIYGIRSFLPESEINIRITRSRSLPEDASLEVREALYHQLLLDCVRSFDKEVQEEIDKHLSRYMVTTPLSSNESIS